MLCHPPTLTLTIIIFLFLLQTHSQLYDLSQQKGEKPLLKIKCNSSTIIYFSFNPTSSLTCSQASGDCSVSVAESNHFTYLDARGAYRQYKLAEAQAVKESFIKGFPYAFLFKFTDQTKSNFVYLAIPFTSSTPPSDFLLQTLSVNSLDPSFSTFKQFSSNPNLVLSKGMPLSGFNFLNTHDFNQFYEVMDQQKKRTLLISRPLFRISQNAVQLTNTSILPSTFSPDYQATADIFCWGSFTSGEITLPMRWNSPLWFFLLAALGGWLFVLISDQATSGVFQHKFEDNKWTCWSLYSLLYLAHEQFFTRMSRTSLFLVNIFWQGLIVSVFYLLRHADQGDSLVLTASLGGWLFSIPVPFIFGNVFLQKIKAMKIRKYSDLIQLKYKDVNEDEKQDLQRDTIMNQQNLRNLYYTYYVTIFITITVIFTASVLAMSSLTYYYFLRNQQWLISMGIIVIFDTLIFEPICTSLFGQTEIYRTRGYYFNGKVAQLYRKAD